MRAAAIFLLLANWCNGASVQPDADGHFRIKVDTYKNERELNFGVIGDWGGFPAPFHNTPIQLTGAKLLGQLSQDLVAKFTVCCLHAS